MLLKTKEDIEFHSDGFRPSHPAVNVKVYDSLTNGYKKWRESNPDENPRFTLDWIEENISDDRGNDLFWSICQLRWEDIENEAREIWDSRQYSPNNKHTINVYSEGRSGGWAIVSGINTDVESWDAIEFNKWRRFAKFARATADGIMWDVVDSIYCNEFEIWRDEQSELAAPNHPEGSYGQAT